MTQTIAPTRVVTYKTIAGTPLNLHLFASPGPTPRPAIVFFFGGGWNGGTPTQFYPQCAHLAARGMVAISAEYRTHSQHGTTPYECVADARSAVRWIRSHAAEFGLDPDRIAAGGGSAGGHLAAATAVLTSFDEPGEDTSVSCRPNALVLFNPVLDNGPDGYGQDRVADRWLEFSPMHNLRPGAPPTIIFLGSEDKLIPVASMAAYKHRMAELGARCDVWIYDGQAHGFFNYRDGANPCYAATLREADRFLVSLGYLVGESGLQLTSAIGTQI